MVEEIVKEIKAFCRNKDVSVMDLREKFDTCYKLVKIWLTKTLVGFFLVSTDTEEIITNKRFEVSEFCGFYSAKKDQLFVEGYFRMMFVFKFSDKICGESWCMFPHQEMMQLLCSAITERCKEELNIEVPDKIPEKLGNPEEVAFFEGGKTGFDEEDVEWIAKYKATIFNSDIEKFLDCPESWAKEKAATILSCDEVKQNFIRVMKCRTEAAAIAQMIAADPEHPWCKIKRLMDAIEDKKTVTLVILRDGKNAAFKMATEHLKNRKGSYYFWNASGNSAELERAFGRTFTINDIVCAQYRGKTIYQDAEKAKQL